MIGTSGWRGSGKSVLAARHDDDRSVNLSICSYLEEREYEQIELFFLT